MVPGTQQPPPPPLALGQQRDNIVYGQLIIHLYTISIILAEFDGSLGQQQNNMSTVF